MTLEKFLNEVGGEIRKDTNGNKGVFFSGPPEAPENSLFIPLNDLGYDPSSVGIYRKSIAKAKGRKWNNLLDI